jgi:1,4-alpha-glucan branching enzyme
VEPCNGSLDWAALDDPRHAGLQRLVRDLNTLYRGRARAACLGDADPRASSGSRPTTRHNSVYAWIRRGGADDPNVVVVCNFTPVGRADYTLALPLPGKWREALNTDAEIYGGAGRGNMGGLMAEPMPHRDQGARATVYLPPLSTVMFVHEG